MNDMISHLQSMLAVNGMKTGDRVSIMDDRRGLVYILCAAKHGLAMHCVAFHGFPTEQVPRRIPIGHD